MKNDRNGILQKICKIPFFYLYKIAKNVKTV